VAEWGARVGRILRSGADRALMEWNSMPSAGKLDCEYGDIFAFLRNYIAYIN
jgi:hypothetical protein